MADDRQNWWFGAAWALLVLVVAAGFFIQAQTINDLHDTQEQLEQTVETQDDLIKGARVIALQRQEQLCDLILTIMEEIKKPTGLDLTQEVIRSFQKVGIDCRVEVEPGG